MLSSSSVEINRLTATNIITWLNLNNVEEAGLIELIKEKLSAENTPEDKISPHQMMWMACYAYHALEKDPTNNPLIIKLHKLIYLLAKNGIRLQECVYGGKSALTLLLQRHRTFAHAILSFTEKENAERILHTHYALEEKKIRFKKKNDDGKPKNPYWKSVEKKKNDREYDQVLTATGFVILAPFICMLPIFGVPGLLALGISISVMALVPFIGGAIGAGIYRYQEKKSTEQILKKAENLLEGIILNDADNEDIKHLFQNSSPSPFKKLSAIELLGKRLLTTLVKPLFGDTTPFFNLIAPVDGILQIVASSAFIASTLFNGKLPEKKYLAHLATGFIIILISPVLIAHGLIRLAAAAGRDCFNYYKHENKKLHDLANVAHANTTAITMSTLENDSLEGRFKIWNSVYKLHQKHKKYNAIGCDRETEQSLWKKIKEEKPSFFDRTPFAPDSAIVKNIKNYCGLFIKDEFQEKEQNRSQQGFFLTSLKG